jgi:subtilisin family serine protease
MDEGVGRPSTYIECLQFFLAPTDLTGANPDPSKRPDVVGNSYTCPPGEGCTSDTLQAAVDNLRAAGIFMAVSAGNEGSGGCSTVGFPPAIYDSAVSVGATDQDDRIAAFSSRGPVDVDGSGRTKPDLVAPGVGVRSSTATGYATASGTSMAAPAAGGAVLLLWSAFPELRGDVETTEQLLEQSAVHLVTTDACGGNSASVSPNNTYGYGRIDAAAAYRLEQSLLQPEVSVADVAVREGDTGRVPVVFQLSLARPSDAPVAVDYATRAGTATAGVDFEAATGTVTFAPGELTKAVRVLVIADRRREGDETFVLEVLDRQNVAFDGVQAVATIRDDDADRTKPTLSRVSLAGSARGSRVTLAITVRLSEAAKVTCTVERQVTPGWRPVGSFQRPVRAGTSSLRVPFTVASGTLRARCVPRDAAGNVGKTASGSVLLRS